jgi:endoglucanase
MENIQCKSFIITDKLVMRYSILMVLLIVPYCANTWAQILKPHAGDLALATNFKKAGDREKWKMQSFAEWVGEGPDGSTVLMVQVPSNEMKGPHQIIMPFDLTPFRGSQLHITCKAKAQDVTKPDKSFDGVRYRLYFKTSKGDRWLSQNDVWGSFDWKELSFLAEIDDDATDGQLYLGLENSSGKVWFDDLRVTVYRTRPIRPLVQSNRPPAFKGHTLPRLRGVESSRFLTEADFEVLTQWNVNVFRQQLYAKVDLRDKAKFSDWLDNRFLELDKVLALAHRYNIKVVLDPFQDPPGGRYKNYNVALYYEQEYNDYFVMLWEKIARRYKGNPAIWGYDLMNEPVMTNVSPISLGIWETQERLAKAIRAIDPDVPVIIEVNDWDRSANYKYLEPINVPNLIYSVHFYDPTFYTHQGVTQKGVNIVYPGKIQGNDWNKETMRKYLKEARDFQLAYNVHMYVGEFSVVRWAPGGEQYLKDCIDLFEEYGWDWTYHAFREFTGWSVEHDGQKGDDTPATTDGARKKLLLEYFKMNVKGK